MRHVVFVRWRDSSEAHGWRELNETVAKYQKPMECVSVGFEVSHTKGKDGVLVVAPHLTIEDDGVPEDASGVMMIPHVAVIEKRVLE